MVERFRPTALPVQDKRKFFTKGMKRPANAGRRKGTTNKNTTLVKEATSGAANALGFLEPVYAVDPKTNRLNKNRIVSWKPGRGGMQGYLTWLGIHHPVAFTTLIGKLIPFQVNSTVDVNATVAGRFANVDISSMSLEEKMAAFKEAISFTKPLPPPVKVVDQEGNDVSEEAEFQEAAE